MTDRDRLIADFVEIAGWGGAVVSPLAGDASNRRYLRLARPMGESAVVMDAPPGTGEDVRPFLRIARQLSAQGLSAPRVLASEPHQGLLLLEDLGDALFAGEVARAPETEAPLYVAAAETLVEVQRAPAPEGLVRFDPAHMAGLTRIAYEWYAPGDTGAEAAVALIGEALSATAPEPSVLALRDFHAENLLWLPHRDGPARVGLLDFQDAVVAHPAYDVISLLDDARRDVADETRNAVLRRFLDLTGIEADGFAAACAAISVQRNLRILGVFARLSRRDGKTRYLSYLPRVWRLLLRNLDHPRLAPLRARLLADLPPPDARTLARLETPCATPVPS
jgi:N-acetylmuramate 1-kinase